MAAMTTVLTEFSDNGNSRTYTTSGHTSSKPKLVISSRRVPSGNQIIAETTVRVSHETEDSDSLVIPKRVSMSVTIRFPVTGTTTDRDAVKAILRDFVASDEFDTVASTQGHPA